MYTPEQIIKAIHKSGGIKSTIAKRAGCTRKTLDKWIADNQQVREAYEEEREKLKDMCESKLVEGIQAGNPTLIIFYAKTQLKDRGYVERTEVTGKDGDPLPSGGPLVQVYVLPDGTEITF